MNNHKPIPELTKASLKRFWSKVNICGPDECWEWTAAKICLYGSFSIQGSMYYAHRVSHSIEHGADPGEKKVCHLCDTPFCCNPAHLFLGTQLENIQDMDHKERRRQKGEQHLDAKLTEQIVREIRASDKTHKTLAEKYGVAPTTIGNARRCKTWKHVD
jgi:hypothetical protein